MTADLSTFLKQSGRKLRFGVMLLALAAPLGACSTAGDLWGKVFGKEEIADQPADKLYNEGLYLLNQEKKSVAAAKRFEEVDRQHPYSDLARKSLLMSAYAHYEAQDY